MSEKIEKLASFVAQTRWEDIPQAVKRHASLVLLDIVGVILAGGEQPEVRRLKEKLGNSGSKDATVFARGWATSDARTAALLNGIAARSIELCEGHRLVACQGAAHIVPGLLAVGETIQSSGRELLAALILGYDVAARLVMATTSRPLAHPNGQATLLGAVAAVARLRRLDAAETSLAMRIGATLMMTPSYTNAVAGATALNVPGGMSGYAAALVPDLALAGFVAQDNSIEQALDGLVADGFSPGELLDQLGTRWEITRNYFRLRACCNPIYSALDALENALAELKPAPDDVERIEVETYRFASVMQNADPQNYFAAKYSLPHAAAALVLKGSAGYESFLESVVHDPAIIALRQRVTVREDPAMTGVAPRLKPARVTLTLKDGRRATHSCESARGDFNRPYQETEIREKFRELAALVLTPAGAVRVEQMIDDCENWPTVSVLASELRRGARP